MRRSSAWLQANTSHTPLELLAAGRWWVVLGVSLLIAVAFLPLRRLLGDLAAALAVLFVAWMPWAVALSRQLHPDGYVSSLIFVALVFFLGWLYGGRNRSDLIVSGVIMGLAWLTKTPAAFLVPVGAILIGMEGFRQRRARRKTPPETGADGFSLAVAADRVCAVGRRRHRHLCASCGRPCG